MEAWIMYNRRVDGDTAEYIIFTAADAGTSERKIVTHPTAAFRYARRYNIAPASAMDYWRKVVCS